MTNSFNSTSVQDKSAGYTLEELLSIYLFQELPLSAQEIEQLDDHLGFSVVWSDNYEKELTVVDVNGITNGSNENDFLLGANGDERLKGGKGDDFIWGGEGNDDLLNVSGKDILIGGSGDDQYVIKNYDSIIVETANNSGKDTAIVYSKGLDYTIPSNIETLVIEQDSQSTRALRKSLFTGSERADIFSSKTDDYIELKGGKNNDTYIFSSHDNIVITEKAEEGDDWIVANFKSSADGITEYKIADNVENLSLKEGSESIAIQGNEENNIIIGNTDDNILRGGNGDDDLDGNTGMNILAGETGDDIYRISSSNPDDNAITEMAEEGDDWIVANFTSSADSITEYKIADNVENLSLKEGSESITIQGNKGNNIIIGNTDDNILRGGEGDDDLDGNAGMNTLAGETGDDIYRISSSNPDDNVITEMAEEGDDWIVANFSSSADDIAEYKIAEHVENLILKDDSANINILGNDSDNTIIGNTQDNFLDGGNGNDHMKGESGKDLLKGGKGNDYLYGGKGHDTMEGGEGNDVFVVNPDDYESGGNYPDIILDFNSEEDFVQINTSHEPTEHTNRQFLSQGNFISTTTDQLEGKDGLQSSAEYVFDESQGILYHNDNGTEPGVENNQNGILALGANATLIDENIVIN